MKNVLLGAHTSAAGGAPNALYQGKEIGATTIQLFTSNQKQWNGRVISDDEIKLWEKALDETGITDIMSHDSYLINLGSPKPELLEKSRKAFREELKRCHLLNITYLNFHPGSATTGTTEECLKTIAESLLEMEDLIAEGKTKIVLETTAGQGTSVGHRFEHIGAIIQEVCHKIPIGVCMDTCHTFVAGYDIRTKEGWDQTLKEFDEKIGLKYLSAFHVNDSLKDLGSRVDRHADIGEGKIGSESFRYLMQNNDLPKYLETPNGPDNWKKEIVTLRKYAEEKN
ncbi:MAG: deoxyribonuclease IV [Chlamydiae bacterium CG10_big_fil_rev_8_21_14_0_10_42_34]|nr:MAG: deoxyribonuclease IV [Chlamydiae bacterium CG10_big_fil_rev_8_21_14_0_10_42_34]